MHAMAQQKQARHFEYSKIKKSAAKGQREHTQRSKKKRYGHNDDKSAKEKTRQRVVVKGVKLNRNE